MADYVDSLTDAELRTKLAEFGFPVVPITTTTRKVMAKKLKMLIENKNKINSEGRRSLAKYSSEEESDEDVKSKKKDSRRITLAAGMLPPAAKINRKAVKKVEPSPAEERIIPTIPSATTSSTSVTTETKTRRTTRIIKPVLEEDLETGSDSEPEIIDLVDEFIDHEHESSPKNRSNSSYTSEPLSKPLSATFSYLSRPTFSSTEHAQPKHNIGSSTNIYNSSSRYTSTKSPETSAADNSYDRLNQIRSRLSLGSQLGGLDSRRTIVGGSTHAGGGDEAPTASTPFLSNFSKRLSQLSNSSAPKGDYNYKNDIIKEHDTNGSSFTTRNYLSRIRNREFSNDFKSSQEKNIFKNNFVSFTLLGVAILFFVVIAMMYVGIRSEQSAISSNPDYILSLCETTKNSKPGIDCIRDEDKNDTLNLLTVLIPELIKNAITHKCTDSSVKPYMTEENIVDFVTSNYAMKDPIIIRKSLHNLHFLILKNPKWKISILRIESDSENTALETIEEITKNGHRKNLALTILDADLPWKCVIYNKLYTIFTSLLVIGAGFGIMYTGQKTYKYYLKQKKIKNDKIYCLIEKIIDILQTNATDNTENFLAVNHVRDMLIPPQERKNMASIWDAAVKFLQENESRVRTEIQIVSGEEFHVWRWLGTNLNATSSPRSKSWQGQAFETQVGSVNSLPCSPTPCLKIRGMFDERERNFYTVREAVLNKCAGKCKILHCEVDLTSGCVYLKCANQAEAAIAYQNLHGWWYDGHLVTVKYLRLERYLQRFPDSPTKGPPYLNPASILPMENDWSNNDD